MLIHIDGSFEKGTADDTFNGPDFLLDHGIIVVTINYRLGVLGSLSLSTPEYSGNMGLKDQQMALKWIHANIEHFNGDNSQITLSGNGAGAAAVNHHMLNDESSNYFQQILCMSNTGNNAELYQDGDHRCMIERFADHSFVPVENDTHMVEFLNNVLVGHLIQLTRVTKNPINPIWAPVVESQYPL